MRRHIAKLLGPLAASSVLILWLAAAPIATAGGGCHGDVDTPAITTESTTEIKLMPCAFAPTVAQVATGSSVTFFNGAAVTHLITGANQAWGSRDAELQPGGTITYRFAKAGAYPYACAIHSGMSGVILVGDVASTSAGGRTAATTTGSVGAPASTAPTSSLPIGAVGLIAGSALVGAVVGGTIIRVATRRRTRSSKDEVPGIA